MLINLGRAFRDQGNFAQSEVCLTEALELTRATHDEQWMVDALENLATVALHQHRPHRAVGLLEESVRLLRGQQFTWTRIGLAWSLIHLAEARRIAHDTGDEPGRATSDDASIRQLWEEGLALLRATEARWLVAAALSEIGQMVYEQGDNVRAGELLRESLRGFHELDSRQALGHVLDAISVLWADGAQPGAVRRAVQLWSAATQWYRDKPGLSPIRRSRYERTRAAVRTELGEEMFAAAWSEGQQLSLDQAVASALGADDRA
jgi:tetratricopeptide (TPR) repeat protein